MNEKVQEKEKENFLKLDRIFWLGGGWEMKDTSYGAARLYFKKKPKYTKVAKRATAVFT